MKFGYHTIRWGLGERIARLFPVILHEISKAGYEGFETHEAEILPFLRGRDKFLRILSETEMQLASIVKFIGGYDRLASIVRSIGYDRSLIRHLCWHLALRKDLQRITRLAEFAASVGCKRLVILGGGKKTKRGAREKDYVKLANALNKIGKKCNNVNIKATYHPHLGTIVEHRDQIDRLCELIDPDLIHLTLDTAHLTAGGVDLIDIINTYRGRINHIHFKDLRNGRFMELGKGTINFPAIINSLKSIGYHGWIIVEDEVNCGTPYAGSSTKTPFESAKNSKKYIDTHLR